MGIFDGFSMPWEDSDWGQTRVTPGAADAGNLSLTERIRAALLGSTDPNPQAANLAKTAGNMFQAASGKPAAGSQQPPPQKTDTPAVPSRPGVDPQLLEAMGKPKPIASPFAAAPQQGQPGQPAKPRIYNTDPRSPFLGISY